MQKDALPKGASLSGPSGHFNGVQFILLDDAVADAWIDDLRKCTHEVRFDGAPLNRHASLTELQGLFGPCDPVPGVKGGTFFNCRTGITLGTDADARGTFVQIRLKAR